MTYLLWSILNIGLFVFFIIICFRATKLIRENVGLFASIIFVFGLFSFVTQTKIDSHNKEPHSNQIRTWKFISEDSSKVIDQYLLDIDLEKNLFSTYHLGIKYGKDKQGQILTPISANSHTTGFVSGTNWEPVSILVNKTDEYNKFEYSVTGVIEWKLLGATIYSQLKQYKGIAVTK